MHALPVIRQNLDHTALTDTAVVASVHHQFQFGFERLQAADTLLDLKQAGLGNGVGRGAGLLRIVLKRQQGTYCLDFETKLTGVTDKRQPAQIGRRVEALIAFTTLRQGQKPNGLIIADGGHLHAALAGGGSNCNVFHGFSACSSSG
jgi:hypothetical protein